MMKLGGLVRCTTVSPQFECQGQRSKVKATTTRNALSAADTLGAYEWYALAANSVQQQWTGPFRGFLWVFSGVVRQFYAGRKNQRMLSSLSVSLSVCLFVNTITSERLNVG